MEMSRNKACNMIILVGSKNFSKEKAIDRMYDTLCKMNQWSALTEKTVESLSIKPNNGHTSEVKVIDYAQFYPYRISDINIPHSNSGYVYMISSTHVRDKFYVGQTANLVVRLNEHNCSKGAKPTKVKAYQPWTPISFICNIGHLSKQQREKLEREWQLLNHRSVNSNSSSANIKTFIENGQRVVNKYNEEMKDQPNKFANYVTLVQFVTSPDDNHASNMQP